MKLDSKYFDKIRVKPSQDRTAPETVPNCEWPGCTKPGRHKAPKGRGRDNEFHRYCAAHVAEYNKSYNYFAGMEDDEVRTFQKSAATGHRPTWKLGQNSWAASAGGKRARNGASIKDPFALFGRETSPGHHPQGRPIRNAELKALNTLGLDENATPEKAKSQYKTLVKRLHPDANNGSRANEDTLKNVIKAYDYLRSTGFC